MSSNKENMPSERASGSSRQNTHPVAWYLYDWANSAFGTIIITFVFSVYVTKTVFDDPDTGSGYWSLTIALAGFFVAATAPFLGRAADRSHHLGRWLWMTTTICAVACACLVFLPPDASFPLIISALLCVAVAHAAAELSYVFYNAMLPSLSDTSNMGRVSGIAWGVGYMGGIASLVLVLLCCIGIGDRPPLLPFPDDGSAWGVRFSAVFVALWYFCFALPLLLQTGANPPQTPKAKESLNILDTLKYIIGKRALLKLLIASALYRDGLATLFAVGGTFAAAAYGLNYTELLIFAIGLNVTAGIGAIAMSRLDDILGSKAVILIALCGLIITGTVILLLESKITFIIVSLFLGLFVGPAQAASRTFIVRLTAPERTAQIFGFYALSGKAIAFLGPLIYGALTVWTGEARVGLASIITFWLAGGLVVLTIKKSEQK